MNSDGSINSNGRFIVDSNGNLHAENAYISGTIESSSGHIGGWSIANGALIGGNTALYSDGTISGASINGAYIRGSTIEADNLIVGGNHLTWSNVSVVSSLSGTVSHATLPSKSFVTDVNYDSFGKVTSVSWGRSPAAVFVNAVQIVGHRVNFRILGSAVGVGSNVITGDR